jgi:cyclic pyranopterin phosphate synthase
LPLPSFLPHHHHHHLHRCCIHLLQATLFVKAGVQKIRLTGGEPTVRKDLQEIIQRLSTLKPLGLQTIAMTSNGIALGRQLPGLVQAGLSLNGLNISLDSLKAERFERLTRRRGHGRVLQSIQQAVDMGFDPVKVRMLCRGTG